MQHTHISLQYYLPGLSTDSALHYPTLPRGPTLATLAPRNIQFSEICELLVNQKPTKLLSQLEILEIMFFVDAQVRIQAHTPKSQNQKSHLKVQNRTSESKISPQSTKTNKKWCCVWCFLFICFWCLLQLLRDVSSETLMCVLCWKTKSDALFDVFWGKAVFCFSQRNSSEIHVTFQNPTYLLQKTSKTFQRNPNS